MSTNTKNLIFKTFVEILGEKPFDKITVRDIVERANVNRNTFYYYYSDIYELLEEMFTREFTEMVAEHRNGFRWLVGFSTPTAVRLTAGRNCSSPTLRCAAGTGICAKDRRNVPLQMLVWTNWIEQD